MSKKDLPNVADADAIAAKCEEQAQQLIESLPGVAGILALAAQLIRAQRASLLETECKHTITYAVTDSMIKNGMSDKEVGRYCMTCGEPIHKPKRE